MRYYDNLANFSETPSITNSCLHHWGRGWEEGDREGEGGAEGEEGGGEGQKEEKQAAEDN